MTGLRGPIPDSLRTLLALAGLVVLLVLGAGLRLAPNSTYEPIPGGYRAYSVYDIREILETGHEIRAEPAKPVTNYSSGIYLGTQDILRNKVDAATMLLLGLDAGNLATYYRYGFWQALLLFPLASLAVYALVARSSGRNMTRAGVLTIVGFAVMGSSNMIAVTYHGEATTATGWALMMAALYGLARIPDSPALGRALFFLFSGLLVSLYHTDALVLASSVLVMAIFALPGLRDRSGTSYSVTTMATVLVGAVAFYAYVSISFFTVATITLARVPSLIEYLIRQEGAAPRDRALAALIAPSTPDLRAPLALLAGLVAFPVAWVVWLWVRGRLKVVAGPLAQSTFLPWLLGLVPFSIGLFAWSGISAVLWKTGEFGSVFAVVALVVLMASRIGPRSRALLVYGVLLCVLLSAFIFYNQQRLGPAQLTNAEQAASDWIAAHARDDEAVFTDLRLASPLIVRRHLAVFGINDQDEPARVVRRLQAVYYGGDPIAADAAIRDVQLPEGLTLRYAMFSKRMEQDSPGIKGFDYNFRAATAGFTDKFLELPDWDLVFDNGTVRVFALKAGN